MSDFKKFKTAIQKQFDNMVKSSSALFLTKITKPDHINFTNFKTAMLTSHGIAIQGSSRSMWDVKDSDVLWNTYLNSFPEGTNEIYEERREYDCNYCRRFIRSFGNIVTVEDNELISIWDAPDLEYPFKIVAKKLSEIVKSSPIENIFISKSANLGIDINYQETDNGIVITWDHFYLKLPESFVSRSSDSVESIQGHFRDSKNVFMRAMEELSLDAGSTILDMIDQGSLYRGEEFRRALVDFIAYKKLYDKIDSNKKDNWCWVKSINTSISRIRNTAIGTLLIDLSEGVDLVTAVTKFEKVVAPTNYKRPKAIFTKKMVEEAQNKIIELGYENSLGRRHAVPEDIKINNVLFANRDIKEKMNASIFDELIDDATVNPKKFNKVEEVSIDDFVKNILPNAINVELMMENKYQNNLMSLIAPQNKDADSIFKWNNNFTWSYNGDIADSMKQRVKKAGGNVDGVLRFSIQWNDGDDNQNDFDAHCIEPNGNHIKFPNKGKIHPSSGMLDVDIVIPGNEVAVENITWTDVNKMQEGRYKFFVHNYSHDGGRTGFTAEIEYDGQIYSYIYNVELKHNEEVVVAEIEFSRENGIKFIKSLDSTTSSEKIWGVKTNKFTKVSMCMYSPNHWDDEKGIGNKHYFFILDGCKNETQPRGFFNEFLKEDLLKHKRVLEALGSKMRVEPSDYQLSGLGFSSTQRNSIIAKVEGSFTRTIKINF